MTRNCVVCILSEGFSTLVKTCLRSVSIFEQVTCSLNVRFMPEGLLFCLYVLKTCVDDGVSCLCLDPWTVSVRVVAGRRHSESDTVSAEVSIVTRKDNPFLRPHGKKKAEEEESDEEDKGRSLVPNVQKDDLARRRTQTGTLPQRDPHQSLAQTSITQSDLEKWQRLSMTLENRCLSIAP